MTSWLLALRSEVDMLIPYVKSKARTLCLRDAETGKMKTVTADAWVRFGALPHCSIDSSPDLELRYAKTDEDVASIDKENTELADLDSLRLESRKPKAPASESPTETETQAAPAAQRHFGRRRG